MLAAFEDDDQLEMEEIQGLVHHSNEGFGKVGSGKTRSEMALFEDDDQLEMEEIQGLVHHSNEGFGKVGAGKTRSKKENVISKAALQTASTTLSDGKCRRGFFCLSVLTVTVVAALYMMEDNSMDNSVAVDGEVTEKKSDESSWLSDWMNWGVNDDEAGNWVDIDDENWKYDDDLWLFEDDMEENGGSEVNTIEENVNPVESEQTRDKDEKEEEDVKEKIIYKGDEDMVNYPFLPESSFVIDDKKWGHWHFFDGEEDTRPKEDYCGKYSNRDIPGEKFPEDAWQTDAVYVNHYLDDAINLVERVKEGIYEEYGHALPLEPEELVKRSQMFHLDILDLAKGERPPKSSDNGGWTTKDSFDGLVRRLLHAMMTNDSFTVVMGGHSAAAGHGNHFLQSYMMQFHLLMEPVFARLGVKLHTHNFGRGGLGTLQDGLGSGSMYGNQVDMILWDSGMTERMGKDTDLYWRQALIGGERPPVLWGSTFDQLKTLNEEAGADIGAFGTGMVGIPETESETQVNDLPWATRYVNCGKQSSANCKAQRFRTKCWIERDDVTPPTKQVEHASSQVSWHPGFRVHQLTGRVLAFTILEAIENAISIWSVVTISAGQPLPDEYWHVSEKYNAIQEKVKNLELDKPNGCEAFEGIIPKRVCQTPMQSRSEFTPRRDPENTSITSILKPAPDGYLPKLEVEMVYDGPDVPNPVFQPPQGSIDVRAIASGRRLNSINQLPAESHGNEDLPSEVENDRLLANPLIVPGIGWSLNTLPGYCDGSTTAICGRLPSSNCLLSGHSDSRGGILGDSFSGWLVMGLKNVKEGLVIMKFETWHFPNENKRTEGWTKENDSKRYLKQVTKQMRSHAQVNELNTQEREEAIMHEDKIDLNYNVGLTGKDELQIDRVLKQHPAPLCDDFEFDYAIDGKITTLNMTQFKERITNPERVVELITLLDDKEMAKQGKARDMEVAVRLRGCQRATAFQLTHVYWA